MSTELTTFFIVSIVVVQLVVMGVLMAIPGQRARSRASGAVRDDDRDEGRSFLPALRGATPDGEGALEIAAPSAATHDRILRILWWLTIGTVLVGVGVSGAFPETQAFIFAGGGLAFAAVFVLHDLLPERFVTPLKFVGEGLFATLLVTALLAATGFGSSPFFFGYYLIAVGAALALGRRATLVYAAIAGLAYASILYLDPRASEFVAADLLRIGLNIGSVWLVAYLAAFFASEERRARAAVVRLSLTDPLTGLFNRGHVHTAIEQEIRRTRRSERGFCLLMLDLDGLKAVNDSRGHQQGDEILKGLAGVVTRSIRNVDTAARYGGDEFVVLLPETDAAGALVVAEKIRMGAEDLALGIDRYGLATSVSIGLASHPQDGATVDELLLAADRAMYTSKSMGKNQISSPPERRPRTTVPVLARAADTPVGGRSVAVPIAGQQTTNAANGEADGESTNGRREGHAADAARSRPRRNGNSATPAAHEESDEELDPAEARRRIARLSYDPDHQVRRAMDAFLSRPGRTSAEEHPDRSE